MKTPAYVQVTGHINQALINIQAGDFGDELDPRDQDLRRTPVGGLGLLFSKAFGTSTNFVQAVEWHKYVSCQSHSPIYST